VMGISRPGDMGFDIVHFNLHKTFTQPHGGGGPGSGPIAVSDLIEPYLPRPVIVRREDAGDAELEFDLDYDRPKSIGRLRGFHGNYGCFVRTYAYICSLGAAGLRDASEVAVLNANYLLARLGELGVWDMLAPVYGRLADSSGAPDGPERVRCMHEFVLSGAPMKRELKIKTLDLAKRLVEPTETETRETLDAFAEAIAEILREAREDPTIAREAPHGTPVRRLDEASAAKRPVLRQAL
jgi:glycine dehydrogenase subunit 2